MMHPSDRVVLRLRAACHACSSGSRESPEGEASSIANAQGFGDAEASGASDLARCAALQVRAARCADRGLPARPAGITSPTTRVRGSNSTCSRARAHGADEAGLQVTAPVEIVLVEADVSPGAR